VVEYGKSLMTPSVFNAHAGNFHNIKTCLLWKNRTHKVAHRAILSLCVFSMLTDVW